MVSQYIWSFVAVYFPLSLINRRFIYIITWISSALFLLLNSITLCSTLKNIYFWLCQVLLCMGFLQLWGGGPLLVVLHGLLIAVASLFGGQRLCSAGLVALKHVEYSRTRDRTYVPCTGRQILNHWATREVPLHSILSNHYLMDIWIISDFSYYEHYYNNSCKKSIV